MKIYVPPIEIAEQEAFTESDLFERAEFGRGLMNLVREVEDPLVVALDAPWGSGKSTFVKMWIGMLKIHSVPVIYFDAFANDYMEDAFLALAGEVLSLAGAKLDKTDNKYKNFLGKSVSAAKILLRSGAKVGVKAATLGALDEEDFDDLKSIPKDLATEASQITDAFLKDRLEKHAEERSVFDNFRSALSDLAEAMNDEGGNSETTEIKETPLVFIIDELDRCKPPFALELIEKIKHFFSVPNVHFVLVTHLEQLENSVRYSYGAGIDARTYLQKFYHLTAHLPQDDKTVRNHQSKRYLNYLQKSVPNKDKNGNFLRQVFEVLELISIAKEFQFRTLEKLATNVSLVSAYTNDGFVRIPSMVACLCTLKVVAPELYQKARLKTLSYEEAAKFLEFEKWGNGEICYEATFTQNLWRYCLEAELPVDFPENDFSRGMGMRLMNRFEIVSFHCSTIIESLDVAG